MSYEAFKVRDRRLHIAYHRAKRAGDEATMREVRHEQEQHDRDHAREYQISDRIRIKVYVRSFMISIGAQRTDRGVNLVQLPHYELECFNSDELRTTALIRSTVQWYEDGKLEELPPSGPWPVQ